MLTPLTAKIRPPRIVTWDLEWRTDTLQLRVAGLYDGTHYRAFLTMRAFLDHVLTARYSGAVFFAHYGGRFDGVFLLEEFRHCPDFHVEAYFNGSSAVRIVISRGRHSWTFADSQFIFKVALAKLGDSIGLPKIDCAFDAPFQELRTYNERDCVILFKCLKRASDQLELLGSELRITLASTALTLFRRRHLKESISTSKLLNEEVKPAYVASRIEEIRRESSQGSCWDVNSSFPASMIKPLPGRHVRTDRSIGDYTVAHVKIRIPELYLPPLPVREGDSIYFPHGEVTGWYATPDIELLEEVGGQVLEVIKAHHFAPQSYFADYIRETYALRLGSKHDPLLYYYYKILMNALYGKIGERGDREVILYNVSSARCPHEGAHDTPEGKATCMRRIGPGIYACAEEREVKHAHLPIPIFVTARSRALLYRFAYHIRKLAYWDTDSLFGEGDPPTGVELGMLKKEYDYTDGFFIRPKGYSVLRSPDEPGQWFFQQKLKGFPKLTREQFNNVARGIGIRTRMFNGPKLSASKGIGEEWLIKSLKHACAECDALIQTDTCDAHPRAGIKPVNGSRPKRCHLPDGDSRPWSVDEIRTRWTPYT